MSNGKPSGVPGPSVPAVPAAPTLAAPAGPVAPAAAAPALAATAAAAAAAPPVPLPVATSAAATPAPAAAPPSAVNEFVPLGQPMGARGPATHSLVELARDSAKTGAASPASRISPSERLPDADAAIQEKVRAIESWALANRKDAAKDLWAFWVLKIPGMLGSAGSAIMALYHFTGLSAVIGFIGALCVLIDSVQPRGTLKNTHQRAFNELRDLEKRVNDLWIESKLEQKRDLRLQAASILRDARNEEERISEYITAAETALDSKKR